MLYFCNISVWNNFIYLHPANLIYFAWDILECLLCHPFKKCISYKSQSRNYSLHKYTFLFHLNKLKFVSQAPILPNWQKFNLSHHLGFPKYTLPESHMNKTGFTESLRQRKLEQGETPNLFYSALYWHPHQGAVLWKFAIFSGTVRVFCRVPSMLVWWDP